VREVLTLALGAVVTASAFLVVTFLTSRAMALPRSTLVLSAVFSLFALVGVRLAWRLRWNPSLAFGFISRVRRGGAPLTLVGDVGHAEAYLRSWEVGGDWSYRPAAILAVDLRAVGQVVHGVPVVGDVGSLGRYLASATVKGAPGAILFLDDPARLGLSAVQIGHLRAAGHRLLRQSSSIELQSDETAQGLREMKLEEFLARPPLSLNSGTIETLVRGKRVLVTGAGGSIGSEIARQLTRLGCTHLTLLDHSEFGLFEIDRELTGVGSEVRGQAARLCNVRDEARLREIFNAERPQIVFHAAALKHVTLVETNPCEGVLTNVLGTWNVAASARAAGVEDVVMISTDKAVEPSNVMGASKRIAEAMLASHASGTTRFTVVRFGNVLGSAGSVVPIFRDQIERGGPVTVTHPDVTRFFMTIPEAVQLVLHATALHCAAETAAGLRKFVLEMGEPVRIIDLARQMIDLSGAEIKIRISGLRPGEKLAEQLIDEGERAVPCIPGITEIKADGLPCRVASSDVDSLRKLALAGDEFALRARVAELLESIRRLEPSKTRTEPAMTDPILRFQRTPA